MRFHLHNDTKLNLDYVTERQKPQQKITEKQITEWQITKSGKLSNGKNHKMIIY